MEIHGISTRVEKIFRNNFQNNSRKLFCEAHLVIFCEICGKFFESGSFEGIFCIIQNANNVFSFKRQFLKVSGVFRKIQPNSAADSEIDKLSFAQVLCSRVQL